MKVKKSYCEGELLSVYVRFASGDVENTREIADLVFADFDLNGKLLGIDFADPEAYEAFNKELAV